LESFGNLKLEHGTHEDKWAQSCCELMKAKLSSEFMKKNSIRGLNFLKIWKIFNKRQKLIFDNLNDYLVDYYNKFGEDKKTHEFLFLTIGDEEKEDIIKTLMNGWKRQDQTTIKPLLLSNTINSLTSIKNSSGSFTIICKCFYLEEIVNSRTDSFSSVLEDLMKIRKTQEMKDEQSILEIKDLNTEEKFFFFLNNALVLPEFLVEYDFVHNHNQNNCQNYLVSSFFNKNEFDENFLKSLNIFNDCCKILNRADVLINKNILNHFDENFFGKFSMCKFKEFEEINSSPLYFVKSSILKFFNDCFRYNSTKEFEDELTRINGNFEEISLMKFQFNNIGLQFKVGNENLSFDLKKLKILNLFKSDLNDAAFNNIISKFSENLEQPEESLNLGNEIEELRVSSNFIKTLDMNVLKIFSNLKIFDVSHNLISDIKEFTLENIYKNEQTFSSNNFYEKLSHIDLSFNQITEFTKIFDLLCNFFTLIPNNQLEIINFLGNPIEKKFLFLKNNNNHNHNHSNSPSESIITEYLENTTNSNSLNYQFIFQINLKYSKQIATDHLGNFKKIKKSLLIPSFMYDYKSIKHHKSFTLTYDTYSFTDKYLSIALESSILKLKEPSKMDEEDKLASAIFLSKKKLKEIPLVLSNGLTNDFHLSKVNVIYLNFNKISKIEGLSHADLSRNLKELYLQNNKIRKIENLNNLENLLKLDLSNNQITKIEGLNFLKSLQWLNLEYNMIENLNAEQLKNLSYLTELTIASNFLNDFKELIQLRLLEKLLVLDTSGNEVCNSIVDFRIQILFYLNKLKVLNKVVVDKNEIQNAREYFDGKITSDLLEIKAGSENISRLVELNLSNCKIKDLNNSNENFFNNETATTLKKLDLSRNLLTSFKIFGFLPNLVELYLNSNLFERIINKKEKQINQKGILGITNLETLEMSSNSISDLFGIQVLKNLKNLILNHNNINKIDLIDGLV